MDQNIILYILFFGFFSLTSYRMVQNRKIISVPVRGGRLDWKVNLLILLGFIAMALYFGKGRLLNYLLFAVAAGYFFSSQGSQGLSEEGVHYNTYYRLVSGTFIPWQDIIDYSYNDDTGELLMVETEKRKYILSIFFAEKDVAKVGAILRARLGEKK